MSNGGSSCLHVMVKHTYGTYGDLHEEMSYLRNKNEELTKALVKNERKQKEYEEYIEELERSVTELERENEALTRDEGYQSNSDNALDCANKNRLFHKAIVEKNLRKDAEEKLEKLKAKYNLLKEEHNKCPVRKNVQTREIVKSPVEKNEIRKLQEKNEKLLKWKQESKNQLAECSEQFKTLMKTKENLEQNCRALESKNANLEQKCRDLKSNEVHNDRVCAKINAELLMAKDILKTTTSDKEINRLRLLNTTYKGDLERVVRALKISEENAQTMEMCLSEAEATKMHNQLDEMSRRFEYETREFQKHISDQEKEIAKLELQLLNTKKNIKYENISRIQLETERVKGYGNESRQNAIIVSKIHERQLPGEICKLRNEKQTLMTRSESLESQTEQWQDEIINTRKELQRVQDEAKKQIEYSKRQTEKLEENVMKLQKEKDSANEGYLNVSKKLKEAEIQLKQFQQRLQSRQSDDEEKLVKLHSDFQKLLEKKNSELNIALEKLSNMTAHSQTLNEQVKTFSDELKLQQSKQTEQSRNYKKELADVYKYVKQKMDNAEVSIRRQLTVVEERVEHKEKEMFDKLNEAEANIHEVKTKHLALGITENDYRKLRSEKNDLQQTHKLKLEEMMKQTNALEVQKQQCENDLQETRQQVRRIRDEATAREELLKHLQQKVIDVNRAKESSDEGQAQLKRRLKEANVQIQKLQQSLQSSESIDNPEIAKLQTQVDDLNHELHTKNDELYDALSQLSALKKQLNQTNDELRFEKDLRKEEDNKHNTKIESLYNKFQQDVNTEIKKMTTKCSELHAGFAKKENDLLAKVSNAERNIQQLQNISSKYHATGHQLETTNQEHTKYLKLVNDKDRSINQLQTEIKNVRDKNTQLNENVKTLRSEFANTSEENRKLIEKVNFYEHQEHSWKQQLEILKKKANIDAAERDRQTELRVEEQRKIHTEEVKQIKLKYENSMTLVSDANLREQKANETIKLLKGELKTLELTIVKITDDHKQKNQDLSEKLSVSLGQIEELKTRLEDTKASEGNVNRRLNERDQQLDQLKDLTKNQDSQLSFFEDKIAENEHQLQQANEQLQHFNKEIQNLKQELHQTKSKLKESAKSNEASDNAKRQSPDSDSLLRQLNQEKELSAALRLKLKDSNNELEDTKTRLSKVMGQRLTDNNPNITDLSDKNRPTKLAERYSELYDNEWTDAFEHLDKIYKDEQKTIASLTVILTEAATFCRNEADGQMETLRKCLILETTLSASRGQAVPDMINKQLKDSRKTMAEEAGNHLVESYIKRLKQLTSSSARDALRVETFLREAVPLCWLMSVQDPPVVFDRLLQHGEKFNTELYRSYTKAGPMVDFPVWPVMFLHEGGPVLYKGVAQGCNK